ncbi:hypothetical protein [Bradyrhizobium sp. URHC0002]
MNGKDRHPSSGVALSKDTIAGRSPGGRLRMVARGGSQPGSDVWMLLLPPWMTAAMASGAPVFVNRMVRRWISRQAFGTERFASAAE